MGFHCLDDKRQLILRKMVEQLFSWRSVLKRLLIHLLCKSEDK